MIVLSVTILTVLHWFPQIEKHLDLIQKQYQDSVNQREALMQRQITTTLRLDRASVLISALMDEKVCALSQGLDSEAFVAVCNQSQLCHLRPYNDQIQQFADPDTFSACLVILSADL